MLKHIVGSMLRATKWCAKLAFLFAAVTVVSIKSTDIHNYFLRWYVGSKMVMITGEGGGGTGFHIQVPSGNTYILTNYHICELKNPTTNTVNVRLEGETRSIPRLVIEQYKNNDICLVTGLPGVTGLTVANNVVRGEQLALVGYPGLRPLTIQRGEKIGESNIQVLLGSDVERSKCEFIYREPMNIAEKFIYGKGLCLRQCQADMISIISYGGNSGSPVVNMMGKVVGVLFAGSDRAVNDSYMVPLFHINDLIRLY